MTQQDSKRNSANDISFQRLCEADPVLVDVLPAIDAVPGMNRETILTSGPPMPWQHYTGGQRDAIIGAALFEGIASTIEEADAKFSSGELKVDGCHDYKCIGSLAGVYSASMPVFVVENRSGGNKSFCNMYEGTNPRRLNYGVYDEGVKERLLAVNNVIAPVIGEAVRQAGSVPLKPLMKRALHSEQHLVRRCLCRTESLSQNGQDDDDADERTGRQDDGGQQGQQRHQYQDLNTQCVALPLCHTGGKRQRLLL